MPKQTLTDAFLQAVEAPTSGRVDYLDTKVRGLAPRVSGKSTRTPEGAKARYLA